MLAELFEGQPLAKRQKKVSATPVSTLMIDGSRAFEERRYQDAVKYFSHAIDNLHDRKADLFHVYDLRSTAHIKLDKHDDALKDAKQMIRLDKTDHRGYLKCAQIEQTQNKYKDALRLCEYGMKNVPQNSKGYQSLDKCRLRAKDQLKQKIIYDKATDPMLILPNELLEIVLSSFGYQQHIAITRVCRTWRDRVRSSDLITSTLDTRNARTRLSYEQIKAAFARLGQQPKFLALRNLGESAANLATSELSRWIRWESLETLILDEPKVRTQHIRWNKMARLQNLRIGHCPGTRQDSLHVLGTCKDLQAASLHVNPITPLFTDVQIANEKLHTLSITGVLDKVTMVDVGGSELPSIALLTSH